MQTSISQTESLRYDDSIQITCSTSKTGLDYRMKAFSLLGTLIAVAAGSAYLWNTGSSDQENGAVPLEEVPAIASETVLDANARVAAMEKAMKENE